MQLCGLFRRASCRMREQSIGKYYYCIPKVFIPTRSFLYHNNGDGTFTEVGKSSIIGKTLGKGLGVVATDINNDGRMDLFVANDTVQDFLYVNRGPGPNGTWKWDEAGLDAGVAFSENGKARSGMGVDAADVNNRGWQDLFVANVDQEMFSLYRNKQGRARLRTFRPCRVSPRRRACSAAGDSSFSISTTTGAST
jgi:enediyne biosynthesis protein E4